MFDDLLPKKYEIIKIIDNMYFLPVKHSAICIRTCLKIEGTKLVASTYKIV